jgi:hypothetical protein
MMLARTAKERATDVASGSRATLLTRCGGVRLFALLRACVNQEGLKRPK